MTFLDLIKLIRHYLKLVISIPIICALLTVAVLLVAPSTYEAKATLLTNGDIALAAGYAQKEAAAHSLNGISVTSEADTTYRTITVEARGEDYGGCIAAVNATVIAAGQDYRAVNSEASITTNEASVAENVSPSVPKTTLIAFFAGILIALCIVVALDMIKMPIKSRKDIETASELPVIGVIPNRDRGERLLANVRFLENETPSSIAVVPIGLTGATLTCSELASAFEHSGIAVSRIPGNPHAEGLNHTSLPGIVTIVECSPLSEGMGAVYIAKDADITIFCAAEWRDSRKTLSSVVSEFRFARAKMGGVVYLTAGYSEESFM